MSPAEAQLICNAINEYWIGKAITSVAKKKDMRVASKEKGYRQGKLGGIPKIEEEEEEFKATLFD